MIDLDTCPYCSTGTMLVTVGPTRRNGRKIFECGVCYARVGVHKKSGKPLGTVANDTDRLARGLAHGVFDRLWRAKMERDGCSKFEARTAAYAWLAKVLEIEPHACHMAMMHGDDLNRVVRACTPPYGLS